MRFAELVQHLEEDCGCDVIHIGGNFHLVTNCIHGTRCIIQELDFYESSTLSHYFLELNVDVPQEFEDFYHVYMAFRERSDIREIRD